VKDFFEGEDTIVHGAIAEGLEEFGHLRLPSRVHGMLFHGGGAFLEIIGFKIADQEATWAEKDGVIPPTGLAERVEHLRPYVGMTFFVLRHFFVADLEKETDSHGGLFVFETCS
jgi:hypothetical protein